MKFSARTDVDLSETAVASLFAQKRRERGVLDLTESNPTRCHLFDPRSILTLLGSESSSVYEPHALGMLSAREAICSYYADKSILVEPNQIVLSASTSEAYSWLFKLLCNRGDAVLVPCPSYPLFEHLAQLEEVQVIPYPLIEDEYWKIDCTVLEKTISENTKAICLIHPNNPTGTLVEKDAFGNIAQIAKKRGLAIIVDEVFVDYIFDGSQGHSFAGYSDCLTFVMSGLSKVAALPQLKLAWTVVSGPESATALQKLDMIADTYLSVSTPVQQGLSSILKMVPEIQQRIKRRLHRNRCILQTWVDKVPTVRMSYAQGGWCCVLQLPRVHSEDEWIHLFAERDNVLVYSGYFFDMPHEVRIVVSLLLRKSDFEEAVTRLFHRVIAECS